jgi:hypothetical protein
MVDQEDVRFVYGRVVYYMVVIEHKDALARPGKQFVDQAWEQGDRRRRLGRFEQREDVRAELWRPGTQRRDKIA